MRQILLITAAVVVSTVVAAQSGLDLIITKWKQKNYTEVIEQGSRLRSTLGGKAIPALDFMILSSICLSNNPRSKPCTAISTILQDYYQGMDVRDFALMQYGMNQICQYNKDPDPAILDRLPVRQYAHNFRSASVNGRFKTYMLVSESLRQRGVFRKMDYDEVRNIVESIRNSKDTLQNLTDKQIEQFMNRSVPRNDVAAINKARARFGTATKYAATENFLVITSLSNKIDPRVVANAMEKALAYFTRTYQLQPQGSYTTIYLVPGSTNVRSYIQKLYGSRISFSPLGFSNFYDNSMVGWLYNAEMVGTLKHELVHLLLRTKFNFLPDWFEEGLATLYEESSFDNTQQLEGKKNWRGILLQETPLTYHLSDLFANKPINPNAAEISQLREEYKFQIRQFALVDYNMRDLYKDHAIELDEVLNAFLNNRVGLYKDALSRYFLLYLQDRGRLLPVYTALLQRDSNVMDIAHYQTLQSTILAAIQKPDMNSLQNDFDAWLKEAAGKN